jgi:hypothetical protein
MVEEMTCNAKSKNNASKYVLLGLGGTSMLFVVAAMMTPRFSGLVWSVAFVFIVSSIYVYTRYVGSEYSYGIIDGAGRPSFTVSLKVGKTERTLARLDLDAIIEVRRLTGKEYRDYKPERGIIKYTYFPTMFPSDVYLVVIRSSYEKADVFVEVDEKFAEALSTYSQNNIDI